MVRTINLADTNIQCMNDSLLLSLISFRTKPEAIAYTKSIGWLSRDVKRAHGRLNGYRWIIIDPHYNAVAHPPKPKCPCDTFRTYGRCAHLAPEPHVHTLACYLGFGELICKENRQ